MTLHSHSSSVPLQNLLHAVAAELRCLARTGSGLEDAVGSAIDDGSAAGSLRRALQGLDGLVQGLGGLATYVDGLAAETDAVWVVDPTAAACSVPLRDLARALLGHAPPEGKADATADFF